MIPNIRHLLSSSLFFVLAVAPGAHATLPVEPAELGSSFQGTRESELVAVAGTAAGPFFAELELPGTGEAATLDAAPGPRSSVKGRGELLADFDGIRSFGAHAVAAGPQHIAHVLDGELWILRRDGALLSATGLLDFFRSGLPSYFDRSHLYSPQVHYSRHHDRFVLATSVYDRFDRSSFGLIAFSRSSDPRGGWWIYRVQPPTRTYLDNISISLDAFGAYFSANLYDTSNTFLSARLWIFSLDVLHGGISSVRRFDDLSWPDGSLARGVRGAVPHTVSSEDSSFFLNTRGSAGSDVLLWRLTGPRIGAPVLTRTVVPVSAYRPIGARIRQLGTSTLIDGGDSAAFHVVYGYRRVYGVWTSDPSGTGSRSEIISLKIDTDRGTVVTEHRIGGGDGWYYFNPSLVVNGGDGPLLDTAVFFSRSHPQLAYPGAGYRILAADGSRQDGLLAGADLPASGSGGVAPWPEYAGAAYDWFDPGRAWASVTTAGGSVYGARIASVALDHRPQSGGGVPCSEDAVTACLAGSRFQLRVSWRTPEGATGLGSWQAIPGSDRSVLFWFFDPSNIELLVKVLDGCGFNEHHWVFSAATTNLEYTLTVLDTVTGHTASYTNPQGQAAPAVTDTGAFSCP